MTSLYEHLVRPIFFLMEPEWVHHLSLAALGKTPMAKLLSPWTGLQEADPVKLWGLTFPNRIGLAAGFDKNAQAITAWPSLGFGHVELGTVTRHAQPGNDRPRIFRVPSHKGVINRMGFPNEGADAIAERLEAYKKKNLWPSIPIGINIGKSKVTELDQAPQDYLYSFKKLGAYADYIVINVSSPNTPGLRGLQQKEHLLEILKVLQEANTFSVVKSKEVLDESQTRQIPILVKIAPDLDEAQIMEVLECIDTAHCDGIVATNTTIDHSSVQEIINETGGLSGLPARQRSTDVIRFISKEAKQELPIIGVGGIFTAEDAKEKLDAGATLLQAYTGFIYQGPSFCRDLMTSH